MTLPLIMGALGVAKGVTDAWGKEQQRKSQRRAYQTMSEITPSEREYQDHLRKVAKGGDPFQNQMMQEQMNRVVGNIRQTGAEQLQRTEGSIIGQGMENSIVAQELRRKVDKDTMRSIAEQSRRISAENRMQQEMTKRDAQNRLFQSRMQTDAREQQMNANIAQLGSFNRLGALANIATAGIQGYVGAGGNFGQGTNPDVFADWQAGEGRIYEEKLKMRNKYALPTGYTVEGNVDTNEWLK